MGYQLEIRHFKYFLSVAEELHFRKAADRLYISQPGLSRQIKQLESELGVTLFTRNNRKVELTATGEFLAKEISTWMNSLDQLLEKTRLIDSGTHGTLKLGYVGSAMQKIIPSLLNSLLKDYPQIKFTLDEMDNPSQITSLINNTIDLGFVRQSEVPSSLEILPVLTESFCLVLPESHHLDKNNFESIDQLKNESFILFEKEYSPTYYSEVISIFQDAGFTPQIAHSSVHALTIYKMVESGFGIAVVPKSLGVHFDMKIRFIDLSFLPQRTVLSAVWNKSNSNPILRHVFDNLPA